MATKEQLLNGYWRSPPASTAGVNIQDAYSSALDAKLLQSLAASGEGWKSDTHMRPNNGTNEWKYLARARRLTVAVGTEPLLIELLERRFDQDAWVVRFTYDGESAVAVVDVMKLVWAATGDLVHLADCVFNNEPT